MKPTTEQILSALNKMLQRKTELKDEKIQLGLADDVAKLVEQAKPILSDLTKDVGFIKEGEKSELKDMRLVEKKNVAYEKSDENYMKYWRLLDKATDTRNTAEREANEAIKSLENQRERIDFLTKRLDKNKGKATKVRSSLEKKLNALEKAAKELGVKIPTGAASKVLAKLISLL